MGAPQTHPDYDLYREDWELLRDCFDGEDAVKKQGTKYLKPTPGQVLDGMNAQGVFDPKSVGALSYENYLSRAVFPDFFTDGVRAQLGILNAKPAKLVLPPELEYLKKDATFDHRSMDALIMDVHEELLITGRTGLFGELPKNPDPKDPRFYIAQYKAEAILNWDDGSFNDGENQLNLVVLDESGYKRESVYSWTNTQKYRVLSIGAPSEAAPMGTYRYAVTEGAMPDEADFKVPTFRNNPATEIPFVFVGPTDIAIKPSRPPLKGLAQICMTIYKGEADYRYALFMQAQETLVVIGGVRNNGGDKDAPVRVGADARIDTDIGGDAKYIGVSSNGLPEQRTALEHDRELAATRSGQLLAPGKMSMESGEALKTRLAAQNATLTSIANATAAAIESLCKKMARWRGLSEEVIDKITCTPNLDFTSFQIQGQDIVQLQTAKKLGAPISSKTIHDVMRERGMTRNTFDEEVELIKKDPKELVDLMKAENEATGNNPIAQAGGGKKPPEDNKAKTKTNQPKE